MGVDAHLVRWKTDSLPQKAPRGTVLSPILLCHIQKYSIDILIDDSIRGGWEEEYRIMVEDFAMWCRSNYLQLNTYQTKEMAVDFKWNEPRLQPEVHRGGRCGVGPDVHISGTAAGRQAGLVSKHRHSAQEGTSILSKKARVCQHLQKTDTDVLPVCGGTCPFPHCGGLDRKQQEGRHSATGKGW